MKHKISDRYKFSIKFSFASRYNTRPVIHDSLSKKTFYNLTLHHNKWNNYVQFTDGNVAKFLKVTRKHNVIVPTGAISINNQTFYVKEGLIHREDGPAIEVVSSYTNAHNYYLDGVRMNGKEYWEKQKSTKNAYKIFKTFLDHQEWSEATLRKKFRAFMKGAPYAELVLPKKYKEEYDSGEIWIIQDPYGLGSDESGATQSWDVTVNGEYLEVEGILHREDGPALTNPYYGTKEYYLYGKEYTLEEFWEKQKNSKNAAKIFANIYGENTHGNPNENEDEDL